LGQLKAAGGKWDRSKLRFYHPRNEPFMPVEFSVAAYRLGHSMVRPGYRLNDGVLLPIFPVPAQGFNEGLTGFRPMNPAWGIDWGRFIDIDTRQYDGAADQNMKRLQFAYRIDTSLVNPLANLPPTVAANPASLAQRNLERGWRMGLPSGQDVARAMGVEPLPDEKLMVGKATSDDKPVAKSVVDISPEFKGKAPLWYYVLAEAQQQFDGNNATPIRLGAVGGRIVAETIIGLMLGDSHSFLSQDPAWTPAQPSFRMADLIGMAIGR
jgi:hypothetical protein